MLRTTQTWRVHGHIMKGSRVRERTELSPLDTIRKNFPAEGEGPINRRGLFLVFPWVAGITFTDFRCQRDAIASQTELESFSVLTNAVGRLPFA